MIASLAMHHSHHATIDSTNSEAQRLASRGAKDPIVITADRQTAGRGRNGRTWQSPLGGAWISVLWPLDKPIEHYASAPLVAGLATLRAIRRLIEKLQAPHVPVAQIKWPNDVLLDDRKVAGILCETAQTNGLISHLVIGVGINVDFEMSQLHGKLRHPPTTLHAALRRKVKVGDVVDGFITQFEILMNRYNDDGLTPGMLRELRSNLAYVGTTRIWSFADEHLRAEVAGLDPQGRLILRGPGTERVIDYGELNAPEAMLADV